MAWPHAPVHWTFEPGIYMVTGGTHRKELLFRTPDHLTCVQDQLFSTATEFGWRLEAWAVLANHYHFVARSPSDPETLRSFLAKLHACSAREVNRLDGAPGRKVWFQFWDTHLTYQRSYLARLNYVHQNAVHHGVAKTATGYAWCSAGWFQAQAPRAFIATVEHMPIDSLKVADDF